MRVLTYKCDCASRLGSINRASLGSELPNPKPFSIHSIIKRSHIFINICLIFSWSCVQLHCIMIYTY
uniref:Uncharacterized protein n=1 Tax=Anguilla anguilla TaxID=7936 RepID=A0A0E9RYY1_ANGAN